MYQVDRPNTQHPSGGSAALIRTDINNSHIKISTNLQAVTLRMSLYKTLTLCSLYISPGMSVTLQDLASLVLLIPSPFILPGDVWIDNQAYC